MKTVYPDKKLTYNQLFIHINNQLKNEKPIQTNRRITNEKETFVNGPQRNPDKRNL